MNLRIVRLICWMYVITNRNLLSRWKSFLYFKKLRFTPILTNFRTFFSQFSDNNEPLSCEEVAVQHENDFQVDGCRIWKICHYICWMGRRYKIHRWSIFYSLVRKHFDVHKKDFIILYLNSRLDIFARAPIIHSVNYDLLLEKNVWQKLIVQYMMCESIFVAYIFPSLSICASLFASKQNYICTNFD